MCNHGASYVMNYIKYTFLILVLFLINFNSVFAAVYIYENWDLNTDGTGNAGSFSQPVFDQTSEISYDTWQRYKDEIYPSNSNLQDSSGVWGGLFTGIDSAGIGGCVPTVANCSFGYYRFNTATNVHIFPFWSEDGFYYSGTNPESSRIISVSPENASTTATSTSKEINAQIYIDQEDWQGNWGDVTNLKLRQTITLNNAPVSGGIFGSVFEGYLTSSFSSIIIEHDIDSFGQMVFASSSSLLQIGQHSMYTEIYIPDSSFFGLFNSDNVLLTKSTYFTVGTTTQGDVIAENIQNDLNALSGTASTTISALNSACNPFSGSFSVTQCVYFLIIPTNASFTNVINEIKVDVFQRAPIGYVTRFMNIALGNATSTLPSITYEFSSSSPLYEAGLTDLHFNPFATLQESNSIINTVSDQSDSENIFDIMDEIIRITVGLVLISLMLKEVLSLRIKHNYD